MSQIQFINAVKNGAISGWQKYKILPSISIAQAVIESGWGTSALAKAPNYNLFGIKASDDWTGGKVNMPTQEWSADRGYYWINAYFRTYSSWNESIEDHGAFFTSTDWRKDRYAKVVGEKDYKVAARMLREAGYATDIEYPNKLIRIIDQYNLTQYDRIAFEGGISTTPTTSNGMSNEYYLRKTVGDSLSSGAEAAAKHIDVTFIGDSLLVGTEPKLKRFAFKQSNYNAKGSRQWTHTDASYDAIAQLKTMLANNQVHNYVVFVLGTNRGVTADEIKQAVDLCGVGRKILLVDTLSEVSHRESVAQAYKQASEQYSNVFYGNWSQYATHKIREYYYTDGANGEHIHMTPIGYERHANFIMHALYQMYNYGNTSGTPKGTVSISDINYDDGIFTSPIGETVIYNKKLNDQFAFKPKNGKVLWIEKVLQSSSDDPQEMLQEGIAYMKEHAEPSAQYIVKLKELPDTVSIGDTGIFVDHEFNPPLAIEARILNITTSETHENANTVTIGNVTELFPQSKEDIIALQKRLQDTREDLLDEYHKGEPLEVKIEATNGVVLEETDTVVDLLTVPLEENKLTKGSHILQLNEISNYNNTFMIYGKLSDKHIMKYETPLENQYPEINNEIDKTVNPQGKDVPNPFESFNSHSVDIEYFTVELLDSTNRVISKEQVPIYNDGEFSFPLNLKHEAFSKIKVYTDTDITFDNFSVIEKKLNKSKVESTQLIARVYQGNINVTERFDNFIWSRVSNNLRLDEGWNDKHKFLNANHITIYSDDIENGTSTFNLKVLDDDFSSVITSGSIVVKGASKPKEGLNAYTHIAYANLDTDASQLVYVDKVNVWIENYFNFMNRHIKNIGGALTVNDMGLVGGKFVPDGNKYSYNPPSISTSEAQVLTIRGLLKAYQSEKNEDYLDMAKWLMDAYLKYYFPYEDIPTTPDANWVPHWMVNVNEPFRGREWFTDGKATFVNGVATFTKPEVIHVYTVRDLDAIMKYDWTPAGDIIGGSYEIEMLDHDPSGNAIKVTLKDKTVNGEKLLSYSTATGKMVNIGDKCESYPVWRPLEEGEIGCAVDTVPWTMDVFNLLFEITGETKWQLASNSMKASIVEISDVSNTEYFIRYGGKGKQVLANGVTSYSVRQPKETYSNTGKEILISYNETTEIQEASIGTWVGNRRAFSNEQWIEVKVGSDKEQLVSLYIDEDEKYNQEKRWKTDVWLSGNGVKNKEVVKIKKDAFYKPGGVVWGSHYGETSNGGNITSANSSITKRELIENNIKVSSIDFVRGDEGGWLGWAQYMLSIWEYTLPFEIKYKTDNQFNVLINDSQDVQWKYPLPKTNGEFKTVKLTEEIFTGGTTIAKGNYKSIAIEAVDETSNIQIEYIGKKVIYDKEYFSTISFAYEQKDALNVGIEYIKPAPSREPLPYVPYVLPFDFHLINYQSTDLRGALYTGYQIPWIYQEGVFEDSELALETNLQFLKDAQEAYYKNVKIRGFFAPIFWWDYREDYGSNTPNTFGMTGNWGDVWGGFQYRTFSDVARVLDKAQDNQLAYEISMDFIKGVESRWSDTIHGFPTQFNGNNKPVNDQTDSQMVANYFKGLVRIIKSNLVTIQDRYLINSQIAKCLEFMKYWSDYNENDDYMKGTWSPNIQAMEWYNYWGGEILDALATYSMKEFQTIEFSFDPFPEANFIGFYSDNKVEHSKDYRDYKWSLFKTNVEVGGSNLLMESDKVYQNSNYLVATYPLSYEPIVGADYTIVINGRLGKGKKHFSVWNSGHEVHLTNLREIAKGVYSSTFKWTNSNSDVIISKPNEIHVYAEEKSVVSESRIEKIKLEKGNVSTDWSLANTEVATQTDLNNTITSVSEIDKKIESIGTVVETTKENFIIKHSDEIIKTLQTTETNTQTLEKRVVKVEEVKEKVDTFFTFDDAFTIGKSNAQTKLRMTNDEIQFLDGETKGTYITGNTMVSQNINIKDKLNLPNHTIEQNGVLTVFRYIGG